MILESTKIRYFRQYWKQKGSVNSLCRERLWATGHNMKRDWGISRPASCI
jgi:hypothetical protein